MPAADDSGHPRRFTFRIEQEVQNPTLDTLLRITSVLEIDLEKIISKTRKAATKPK